MTAFLWVARDPTGLSPAIQSHWAPHQYLTVPPFQPLARGFPDWVNWDRASVFPAPPRSSPRQRALNQGPPDPLPNSCPKLTSQVLPCLCLGTEAMPFFPQPWPATDQGLMGLPGHPPHLEFLGRLGAEDPGLSCTTWAPWRPDSIRKGGEEAPWVFGT